MWPLNQPVRAFLRLPGATSVAWAVFDPDWYRATYPAATVRLAGAPADTVLAFYLDVGQGLGHSPNRLFNEAWHRRAYPAITAGIQAGDFASAFDAYCRGGCLDRSPHWLFDERHYRRRHPDLTDDILAERGLVNGYDHYLWRGNAEGRIGHPLFNPAVYRAQLDPENAAAVTVDGPFWHCLRRLDQRAPEVRTSVYFDPAWYLQRYPAVAGAIACGTWRWALEHYLCNDTPTAFDPNPAFSEAYYLAQDPTVAGMVQRQELRNGFAHFLHHGAPEHRSPSEPVNLAWYAAQDLVRQDLAQGLATDAFTHWLTIGQQRGLPSAPPPEEPITEAQTRALFHQRTRILSVLFGRTPLQFAPTGAPALSVIMVVHNQFPRTLAALGSLRSNYPDDIELILVDCGSTDATSTIERYIRGAKRLRFDTNIGYLRGCNAGLLAASADAVLYLSNEIELAPGAINAALHRLDSDPRIGAVGGMVIRTHGILREAGGIIWRDGTTQGYMHDASPLMPEANFARAVDFFPGVFLMTRRTLLNTLEGFDAAFTAAGYADADLCIRMADAGYRVMYDPAVVLHHCDSATSNRASAAEISQARQVFVQKHADDLAQRHTRDERMQVFARMANTTQKRVLFLEDTVPLRLIGSGFVRSNDIVRAMASMGYGVTVYPLNGSRFDPASVYADLPDGVEVMHDGSLERFADFVTLRQGYYHTIWIARTHNLDGMRPDLERAMEGGPRPQMILDTEAIASVRDAEQAALEGQAFDLNAAARQELRNGAFCEKIVAVTEPEAAMLRELGFPDVAVIGHMRALHPTPRPFEGRSGMLFVGAIHRMDSPNYDSLCWFIDEVLPLVERELGWQTRLTVAGYTGADVSLDRFRDHPRVSLRGTVAELEPLYDSHRVFVAPTRIAAGTPYKVHEAASFGLPAVVTELLQRQLGWEDSREVLGAKATDPATFARQVVALQRDEALWQRLRDAALERLRQENSQEDYAAAIAGVLGSPTVTG